MVLSMRNSKSKTRASSACWRDINKSNETGRWEMKKKGDRDDAGEIDLNLPIPPPPLFLFFLTFSSTHSSFQWVCSSFQLPSSLKSLAHESSFFQNIFLYTVISFPIQRMCLSRTRLYMPFLVDMYLQPPEKCFRDPGVIQ